MKKVKVYVEKSVIFFNDFVIGVPENMTDDTLDRILKELQEQASSGEMSKVHEKLNEYQIIIIEQMEKEDGEPAGVEYNVSCYDYIDTDD